jgi:hypothetical protein
MQTPDRQVVDLDGAEMHFLGVAASAFAVASVNFCTLRRSTLMFLGAGGIYGAAPLQDWKEEERKAMAPNLNSLEETENGQK